MSSHLSLDDCPTGSSPIALSDGSTSVSQSGSVPRRSWEMAIMLSGIDMSKLDAIMSSINSEVEQFSSSEDSSFSSFVDDGEDF